MFEPNLHMYIRKVMRSKEVERKVTVMMILEGVVRSLEAVES